MSDGPSVLVLAGGPDAERGVSIRSATAVADALRAAGLVVEYREIDTLVPGQLAAMPGDVVFPVLHGVWGEGGPLQDLLEASGRPYVGSGPRASRLAMDKMATKLVAAGAGVPTPDACLFHPRDEVCPIGLPAVLKPVREGSSYAVSLCRTLEQWYEAADAASADVEANPGRTYMCEQLIPAQGPGRELTVGLVDTGDRLRAQPIVEILPAVGFYDLEAKYSRDDTVYVVDPELPEGLAAQLAERSETLARAMDLRHLARIDFLLDEHEKPWLLEVNTMPGFTSKSLLPMACAARGVEMPELCATLARLAAGAPSRVRTGA